MKRYVCCVVGLLVLPCLLAAETPAKKVVVGAPSSLLPMVEQLTTVYKAKDADVQVEVKAMKGGRALRMLAVGKADLLLLPEQTRAKANLRGGKQVREQADKIVSRPYLQAVEGTGVKAFSLVVLKNASAETQNLAGFMTSSEAKSLVEANDRQALF